PAVDVASSPLVTSSSLCVPSSVGVGPVNFHQLNLNALSPLPVNVRNRSCTPSAPLTGQVTVVQDEAPDTSQVPNEGPVRLSRCSSIAALPLADETRTSKLVTPWRKSTSLTLM